VRIRSSSRHCFDFSCLSNYYAHSFKEKTAVFARVFQGIKVARRDLFRAGLLLGVTLLLNFSVLSGNWRWDDPQILLHLHQYSIFDDFINPQVWQQFSPANLTPWLILSFESDLTLFGMNPGVFYLHQLLALAAAAVMLYLCMTLWLGRGFAFFGAVLFLVGAPSQLVTEQLMTRHYVEGLVFVLLSLYLFVRYLRTGSKGLWVGSAALYVLAITAKEIYVPLVLLLPFLPESAWRQRLQAAVPFMIIATGYTLWRAYMLGTLSGGYVDSSEYLNSSVIIDVMRSFANFPELLLGGLWPAPGIVYLLMLGLYAVLARSWLPLVLLSAALVLLPLVPLVSSPGISSPDRYLLLLWVVLSFSLTFFAARLIKMFTDLDRAAPIVLIYAALPMLLLISLFHGISARQSLAAVAEEFDVQAQFIWAEDASTAFVPSATLLPSFWFFTGLQDLKRRLLNTSSPRPVVDAIYLDPGISELWALDKECMCMRDISDSIPERIAAHQQHIAAQAPLALNFDYQDGYFSWQFGPYDTGAYHIVSDVIGVIPAPAAGRLRVTLPDNAPFFLRYTSAEEWVTYSSLQQIHADSAAVNWLRD